MLPQYEPSFVPANCISENSALYQEYITWKDSKQPLEERSVYAELPQSGDSIEKIKELFVKATQPDNENPKSNQEVPSYVLAMD